MSFCLHRARSGLRCTKPAIRGRAWHSARGLAALAAILAATAPAPARADSSDAVSDRRPEETLFEEEFTALALFERMTHLRPRVRLLQDATIAQDFGAAEVDRFQNGLRADVAAPLSHRLVVRLVGEVSAAYFDFDGNKAFLDTNRTGDPFDSLMTTQLRLEGRYEVFDDWAVVAGTEFGSRWEEGSRYDRGVTGSGFFGVAHLWRERFSVVLGMRVSSRMGRSGAGITPLAQIGWRVTEDIEIETRGLGLNVAVRLNKKVTLLARGGLTSESHRLDDRGGTIQRGILQERSLPITLGARWRITKHWRLHGDVGATLYQRYGVYDHNDNFVDSSSSRRPAFTGHVDLEYRF